MRSATGLRKRVVQGQLSREEAVDALEALGDLELDFHGGTPRWLRSLRVALDWNVTSYDALYLSLALDLDTELVTADRDMDTLGLRSRSEAVREGLRLLHKQAEQDALAREYDNFYGEGQEAPPTDMTTVGDQLAADVIQQREAAE